MAHVATETFVQQTLIGPYAVDEIPAPLQITFKDCNNVILDLSGFTPEFKIVRLDGTTPVGIGAGAATIPDPVNGLTQYEWAEIDFEEEGMYRGVMWCANGTLRYASIFFEWFIRDSLTVPTGE